MTAKVVVIGNLGKDPEMRFTATGQAVCSFSVAHTRKYTSNNETVKETTWFRVSVWGKLAEVCNQYLKKGAKVYFEGRLSPDKNTGGPKIFNKNDGTSGASYDVVAEKVEFLSRIEVESASQSAEIPAEEDMPF